jgi:predicted transcriptional regulator
VILTPELATAMRRQAGMTQGELAKAVGVSQSYIARIESGTLDPKLSVANKILEILNKQSGPTLADVMTADPTTVDARDSVMSVVPIMQERAFSQLPVVRSGRVVGIITELDVVRNLNRNLSEISVQAIMDPVAPPMFDENTPLSFVVPLFESFQAVLVQKQGRLVGVVTRADAMKSLH